MTTARPRPLGDENRHYWLALSMAKSTGTDLQAALEQGRISHEDWASLVTTCRGCDWVEGCACWLARQKAGSAEIPDTCPNAAVFAAARDGQARD